LVLSWDALPVGDSFKRGQAVQCFDDMTVGEKRKVYERLISVLQTMHRQAILDGDGNLLRRT
jgi:hypothetical protein